MTEENQIPEDEKFSEEDNNSEKSWTEENQKKEEDYSKVIIDLKKLIAEWEKILEVLKPLTSNWEIYKEIFEVLKKEINDSLSNIKNAKTQNTKYSNELEDSKKKIEQFLEESKSKITEFKTIILAIKDLEKIAKAKGESIESLEKDTKTLKESIEEKKKEVTKLFNEIKKSKESWDKLLNVFIWKEKEWNEIILKLKEALKVANTNTKELNKFYKEWKESFDKISLQSKKIDSLERLSETKTKGITTFFSTIFDVVSWKKSKKEEFEEILIKMKAHQAEIDKQLFDASSLRLSWAFKEKRDNLEKDLSYWQKITFALWVLILVLNFCLVFIKLFCKVELWYFEHVIIILPIAILFWFAILEHARLKKILDVYSFKYIEAFSMPAYTDLIENRDTTKASNFLINTVNDIYKNPTEKINSESKNTILDYLFDLFKSGKKSINWVSNFELPEIEGDIGGYTVSIKKDN